MASDDQDVPELTPPAEQSPLRQLQVANGATVDDYVDIAAIHPNAWEVECWNCDHSWYCWTQAQGRVCTVCLMGQEQTDHGTECETPEGYTDYGRLWYGDIPREEMYRKHAETREELRERNYYSDYVEVRL